MALIKVETLAEDVCLGLWKIEESEDWFIHFYPWLQRLIAGLSSIHSLQRRLEILAIYALLYELTHDNKLQITHDENGAPCIPYYNIGISHTKGYAALIISSKRQVAVDIEYRSDRVGRIAHKFIRIDEFAPTIIHQLLNWSTKETVYKYFSSQKLSSSDIKVCITSIENTKGMLSVENLKEEKVVTVFYQLTPDYVLTFLY